MTTTPAALTQPASRFAYPRYILKWTLSFLAIPIAGYFGAVLVGPVDSVLPALVGGALVGVVMGLAQALLSSGRLPLVRWVIATTIGAGVGVTVGTLMVGYQSSLGALALGGLVTGLIVGTAQAVALPRRARLRWLWVPATVMLWPLAWTVTTVAGIAVEEQFIVFGSSGALVYTVLAGMVLHAVIGRPAAQAQ